MTWTIKIKHTRPNTDVEFYKATESSYMNDSDTSYVESTYKDTGKRVSSSSSLSENELELTKTHVYRDEASKNAYDADSRIQAWISACNSYNTTNNISKAIIQDEET
jgi:hypothetical protein